jgi:OCT family organic cation transporter-like MFS transporter 4/5
LIKGLLFSLFLNLSLFQNQVIGGDLGVAMPLMVFGMFAFVAGLLALALPETKGRHLPESIKDSVQYTK